MRSVLLPDCGGAIRRIALVFPPWYLDADYADELRVLGATLGAFGRDVTLLLLTEQGAGAAVRSCVDTMPHICATRVIATAPDGSLRGHGGIWVQDSFLSATDGYRIARTANRIGHADLLAAEDGMPVALLDVALEGGDCLVGPDFWLVGAGAVTRSAEHLRVSEAEAEIALAAMDPRPLHVVGYYTAELADFPEARGKRHQPWFHIDLMVSVTGLRQAGKPVLLVADARDTADAAGARHAAHAPRLDATARRLESQGFHVIRNPVPVLKPARGGGRSPRAYNNVLVQNEPAVVWLPCFADLEPELAACDAANRQIWEQLGFTVVPVPGWSALSRAGGALRCATKILARD